MKTLCVASFCFLALATPSFAAMVVVTDGTAALPGVAADTTALLLDAGLPLFPPFGTKRSVTANKFHCDQRNNGALPPNDFHSALETIKCRINSKNQKDTNIGTKFGDQRALRDLLQKIQNSTASGGTTFTDCATGYCGTFAKSIKCTIDTSIPVGTGGRWSCTYVDGQ
jgi:hypothetical protein